MNTQRIVEPPKEIRLRKAQKRLEILWADGRRSFLSCLALRKACACSNCEKARQQALLSLIDAEVGIDRLELSGVSGLQFHFSDGHFRGLYPWGYLRDLGEAYDLDASA